jgi:hypothetical protein
MRAIRESCVLIVPMLLGVLLGGCGIGALPSSFGVPPVARGYTVTYGGLVFTVPKSWKVIPGSKTAGDCMVSGNSIEVGPPGLSVASCNNAAIPVISAYLTVVHGSGPAAVVGDPVVRRADIHGVVVTLENGYPVQLGGVNLSAGEKPSSQRGEWPVLAVFRGYNVQFGVMGYTIKQKATVKPVLAVLDSVHPVG